MPWGNKSHDPIPPTGTARLIVVSDTLSSASSEQRVLLDKTWPLVKSLLNEMGMREAKVEYVADEVMGIRSKVLQAFQDDVSFLIISGGTGFSSRDLTPEAVKPLIDRELEGFGEEFRRRSVDTIGSKGLISRAFAGFMGSMFLVALPGNPKAVQLGLEIILPVLGHLLKLARNQNEKQNENT